MFHSLEEFKRVWQFEYDATMKLFTLLSDESLSVEIAPGRRSLGRLANHLVETLTEMPHKMGLPINEEYPAHTTVAALCEDYRSVSEQLISAINANWTDNTLAEMRLMYGEEWSVADTLHAMIMHQCHHRGQITVLMRQAGLPVTGLYGPAKEEWALMGMQPLP